MFNALGEVTICGRKPLRGEDLKESIMLEILCHLQTGGRNVETLRSYLFTEDYSRWAKANFGCQLTKAWFESALRSLYAREYIRPRWEEGDRRSRTNYKPSTILRYAQNFEITWPGNAFLQKHLKVVS